MIREIRTDRIVSSNKLTLRVDSESGYDFEELVGSIAKIGLIEPLVVRPLSSPDSRPGDYLYEIICGHRRHAACRKINIEKIPCNVLSIDDREALEVALTENIQRKSLNPIEEAEAFKMYIINYGRGGITRLAKRIGKSEEYVSHKLLLLGLPKSIVDRITRRLLKPSVATELLWLPDQGKQEQLAAQIVSKNLSQKETREIVRLLKKQSIQPHEAVNIVLRESRDDKVRSEFSEVRADPWSTYRGGDDDDPELGLLNHATLILRTCLNGIDMLLEKAPANEMHELLLRQRQTVHSSLDEIIVVKSTIRRTVQISTRHRTT